MSQQASDHQLGQRFAKLLITRRPIELPAGLGLLQDLMGADVSLLPSIRLLASQPTFLKFINAKPSAVLLPQRDALLTTAHEILAPALLTRIANFLDGYLSFSSDQSASNPPSEPQMPFKGASRFEPSFPAVLSSSPDELPSTVIDQFAAHSTQSSKEKQARPLGVVLFVLAAVAVVFAGAITVAVFKVPELCEPIGLCPEEKEPESDQKEGLSTPSAKPPEATPPPSLPEIDEGIFVPTPSPAPKPTPYRDEPLW